MSLFGWECRGCGGSGNFETGLDTLFDLEKRAKREHDAAGHRGCAGDVRVVVLSKKTDAPLWQPQEA